MFRLVSINDIFQEFDKQTNKQTNKKKKREVYLEFSLANERKNFDLHVYNVSDM